MPKLKERPVADEQVTATYTLKEVVEMMNARFDRFENKMDKQLDRLENKMDLNFAEIRGDVKEIRGDIKANFKWALSLILGSWLTIR